MSLEKQFRIVGVDYIDGQKILVEFSDETHAVFTLVQLLSLTPDRTPSNTDE
jgi:hypothetical protein